MKYFAIYVERFCGDSNDPEWHSPECLSSCETDSREELERSFHAALWGTSLDDFVYIIDETDPNKPQPVMIDPRWR